MRKQMVKQLQEQGMVQLQPDEGDK